MIILTLKKEIFDQLKHGSIFNTVLVMKLPKTSGVRFLLEITTLAWSRFLLQQFVSAHFHQQEFESVKILRTIIIRAYTKFSSAMWPFCDWRIINSSEKFLRYLKSFNCA